MTGPSVTLRQEEAEVQTRSEHLRKDLGVADLTLTQILFIVGLPWVGVAAKQGPAHVVFWVMQFALKISSVIVLTNIAGWALFRRAVASAQVRS